ncbi:MAG: Nif11-like leader peptide family natural product precursor [Sulfurovaceae bacterium]|nr:Nif11-like leader peptide family natural product precursor [Sulfurovaceae bacterium]
MSKDQVNAFFDKVETNKQLQDVLKTLEKESDIESSSDSLNKVIDIAKKSGFDFSADDYVSVLNTRAPIESLENSAQNKDDGCYVTWGCSSSHPLWSQPEPEPEPEPGCGQGVAYIPPGYEPGDEDNV